jgi:hypothetical protein
MAATQRALPGYGNELQVFAALYRRHQRTQLAGVAIIPGAGFGVVATNRVARYVSDAVGGAQHLDVAARAATAQPRPRTAASIRGRCRGASTGSSLRAPTLEAFAGETSPTEA